MEERKILQVTNITHSASETELIDLFSIAGDVSRVCLIQSGFPYYAFVEYHNAGNARRAINLSGKFFGPSKITVAYSTQPFPGPPLSQGGLLALPNSEQQPLLSAPVPRFSSFDSNKSDTYSSLRHTGRSQHYSEEPVVQLNKPVLDNNEVTEVLLSNIPVSIKEHNIHHLFSEFGSVADVTLITDASGLATGKGKVSFTSLLSASKAVSAMNGRMLEGSYAPLNCTLKSRPFPYNRDHEHGSKLDLRNSILQKSSTQHQNNRHHPYPGSNQTHQQYQAPVGNNPNYAAPMVDNMPPVGQPIHQHFDPMQYGAQPSYGQIPQPSSFNIHGGATHALTPSPNAPAQISQRTAVYVGNLPDTSCKSCLLYQLFAPYGAIDSVKAMDSKNESGDSKDSGPWYGFINYKDLSSANLAIMTLDKSTLDGNVLKVVIKTEKPGRNNKKDTGFYNKF